MSTHERRHPNLRLPAALDASTREPLRRSEKGAMGGWGRNASRLLAAATCPGIRMCHPAPRSVGFVPAGRLLP